MSCAHENVEVIDEFIMNNEEGEYTILTFQCEDCGEVYQEVV